MKVTVFGNQRQNCLLRIWVLEYYGPAWYYRKPQVGLRNLAYYLLWSTPINNVLILYRMGMRWG